MARQGRPSTGQQGGAAGQTGGRGGVEWRDGAGCGGGLPAGDSPLSPCIVHICCLLPQPSYSHLLLPQPAPTCLVQLPGPAPWSTCEVLLSGSGCVETGDCEAGWRPVAGTCRTSAEPASGVSVWPHVR